MLGSDTPSRGSVGKELNVSGKSERKRERNGGCCCVTAEIEILPFYSLGIQIDY